MDPQAPSCAELHNDLVSHSFFYPQPPAKILNKWLVPEVQVPYLQTCLRIKLTDLPIGSYQVKSLPKPQLVPYQQLHSSNSDWRLGKSSDQYLFSREEHGLVTIWTHPRLGVLSFYALCPYPRTACYLISLQENKVFFFPLHQPAHNLVHGGPPMYSVMMLLRSYVLDMLSDFKMHYLI
jgi:hypothetical protein